MITKREN